MDNKFIAINLDDERSKEVAKILGNKTCKKIIDHLSENKEASEKDIADALGIPLNTTEYNLKKLIKTGLVEKTQNFFWSKKGKKIPMYKLSNKSIIISPSKKFTSEPKTILPVAFISGLTAIAVRQYFLIKNSVKDTAIFAMREGALKANEAVQGSGELWSSSPSPVWIWFLAGALFALLIYSIIQFLKIKNHKSKE